MLVQHLNPQNAANFSECLEMVDVNYERSNGVVEDRAEAIHVSRQLGTSDAEELIEQAMLVLANVDEECAR